MLCSPLQAIKHFLDPNAFKNVRFVYPRHYGSMELMHEYFDLEVLLSVEFGGKNEVQYDHEEFSWS